MNNYSWKVEYSYVTQTDRNEVGCSVTMAEDVKAAIEKVMRFGTESKVAKSVFVTKVEFIGEVI